MQHNEFKVLLSNQNPNSERGVKQRQRVYRKRENLFNGNLQDLSNGKTNINKYDEIINAVDRPNKGGTI